MNTTVCESKVMNIISLGAGVQSSTMALMAAAGEITPMPDAAVFADTKMEPTEVYLFLEWIEQQLPFPVHHVSKGNLYDETMRPRVSKKTGKTYYKFYVPTYTKMPDGKKGMLPRKCTTDFKLVPIYQELRRISNIPRGCKEIRVKSWIGISTDEATRIKPATITKRINGKSVKIPHPWAVNCWPLIEKNMSRNDCIKWMTERGYPEPPKSACIFCPYHSNDMWRKMKKDHPDQFAIAVQYERDLEIKMKLHTHLKSKEYLHSSRIPLDKVDFSTAEERGQINLFTNECEGMCGV